MHLSAWEINPIQAALESIELPPTVRTVADLAAGLHAISRGTRTAADHGQVCTLAQGTD